MILTCDIGNSRISLRGIEKRKILFRAELATDRRRSADEYALSLRLLLQNALPNAPAARQLNGGALCSVVPSLTETWSEILHRLTGQPPVIVKPGTRTGLRIRAENQAQVGGDIVAGLVGAEDRLGAPVVVLDLGTATTVSALNAEKDFFGVAILPGLRLGADALAGYTALLPEISLTEPKEPLCRSTQDAACAGIVLGHACLLDGYLSLVADRYFDGALPAVALTGGLAPIVKPYLRHPTAFLPDLVCEGLARIFEKNREEK